MYRILCLSIFFISVQAKPHAQVWVDSLYGTAIKSDVVYGKASDFNGVERSLQLDIHYPVNDRVPVCGRPLLLAIHGGAFMAGTRKDPFILAAVNEFAARGYVAVTVEYRLGMFQTDREVHCNVTQLLNTPWDCLNIADTIEWHRAWFRAVQDVHQAIGFLCNDPEWNIDRRNIYVLGESAGAITALGVGFLDDPKELLSGVFSQPSLKYPNSIYEQTCIVQPGFNTRISNMNVLRPDLTSSFNPARVRPYQIKGVAAFYGATFFNIMERTTGLTELPLLYLFHQTNDMVVPIGSSRLLNGVSQCFSSLASCQDIVNRPYAFGSDVVEQHYKKSLTDLGLKGKVIYDRVINRAECLEQILNPATGGHQVDAIKLRLKRVMELFSENIIRIQNESCVLSTGENADIHFELIPNPVNDMFEIQSEFEILSVQVFSVDGKEIHPEFQLDSSRLKKISTKSWTSGIYHIHIHSRNKFYNKKIIKL